MRALQDLRARAPGAEAPLPGRFARGLAGELAVAEEELALETSPVLPGDEAQGAARALEAALEGHRAARQHERAVHALALARLDLQRERVPADDPRRLVQAVPGPDELRLLFLGGGGRDERERERRENAGEPASMLPDHRTPWGGGARGA